MRMYQLSDKFGNILRNMFHVANDKTKFAHCMVICKLLTLYIRNSAVFISSRQRQSYVPTHDIGEVSDLCATNMTT